MLRDQTHKRANISNRLCIVFFQFQRAFEHLLRFRYGTRAPLAKILKEVGFAQLSNQAKIIRVRRHILFQLRDFLIAWYAAGDKVLGKLTRYLAVSYPRAYRYDKYNEEKTDIS